jgi:hypothetical protein
VRTSANATPPMCRAQIATSNKGRRTEISRAAVGD